MSCLYAYNLIIVLLITEEEITVETVWVLSLSLKVLNNTLKSMSEGCPVNELFESSFIQCLVYIASKGTGFSQQWMLKDLEVS